MIKPNWKWTNDIEDEVLNELSGCAAPIAHICSATSGIGDIRVDRYFSDVWKDDRKNFGMPNVQGEMTALPIKSGVCGAVICDPPYSPTRYGKYFPALISELVRITAPRGKIIFLCPWVLQDACIEPLRLWMRPAGINRGAFPSYKILSISQKTNGQITDYNHNELQDERKIVTNEKTMVGTPLKPERSKNPNKLKVQDSLNHRCVTHACNSNHKALGSHRGQSPKSKFTNHSHGEQSLRQEFPASCTLSRFGVLHSSKVE